MAAVTVITFSEYGDEAVLVTVRSLAEPRVETITLGWRATKIVTTTAAMVRAVAAKARPSRPRPTCQAAARAASTATTAGSDSDPPAVAWVQTTRPTAAAAASGPTRRPTPRARSRSSPEVLRARKLAPCCRHSSTRVRPQNSA
jgi:hypothetical protein